MNITEVRVKLVGEESERLRAFCSVTIDDAFVIRDLKIIDGDDGPFVAMPSRKMCDHCPKCGEKNHLRARFCNECGAKLNANRAPRDETGRVKLYADVAHPINVESREQIQDAVLEAYHEEHTLSLEPGYEQIDSEFEDYEEYDEEPTEFDALIAELRQPKQTSKKEDRRQEPEESAAERSSTGSNARVVEASFASDEADAEAAEESDEGFAAGLDWSAETPEPQTGKSPTAASGDNGHDEQADVTSRQGPGRRRGTASPATSKTTDDKKGLPPSASSEIESSESDDFGAGII